MSGRTVTALLGIVMLPVWAGTLLAQDTVRVGITYQPGVRPGLVVLPAPGLDSVQVIVARDLDFSDRFELIALPASGAGPASATINFALYRGLGAGLAVELAPATGSFVRMRLYDLAAEKIRGEVTLPVDKSGAGESRMAIHALSDEIVRLAIGQPGSAATRILFLNNDDKRIWRVDSDGAGLTPLTPAGVSAMSPVWSPDGAGSPIPSSPRTAASPSWCRPWAAAPARCSPSRERPKTLHRRFRPTARASFLRRCRTGASRCIS